MPRPARMRPTSRAVAANSGEEPCEEPQKTQRAGWSVIGDPLRLAGPAVVSGRCRPRPLDETTNGIDRSMVRIRDVPVHGKTLPRVGARLTRWAGPGSDRTCVGRSPIVGTRGVPSCDPEG